MKAIPPKNHPAQAQCYSMVLKLSVQCEPMTAGYQHHSQNKMYDQHRNFGKFQSIINIFKV